MPPQKQPESASSPSRRSQTTPAAATPASYLEGPSDIIGDLTYDFDLPLPVPGFAPLHYPLAPEVFCSYRPTMFELQSLSNLLSVWPLGPPVDLLDPLTAYPPPGDQDVLAPEDAALLVGAPPPPLRGGPRGRSPAQPAEVSPPQHPVPVPPPSLEEEQRSPIDRIESQFPTDQVLQRLIHPQKPPHVKPVRVLPVLPHPHLRNNRYLLAALQDVDIGEDPRRLILETVGRVSARLRTYALYRSDKPAPGEEHEEGDRSTVRTYRFIRDFAAKFPDQDETMAAGRNLTFELPASFDFHTQPPAAAAATAPAGGAVASGPPAYVLSFSGPKILFTKSPGLDGKRYRQPFRLEQQRPPSDDQEASSGA